MQRIRVELGLIGWAAILVLAFPLQMNQLIPIVSVFVVLFIRGTVSYAEKSPWDLWMEKGKSASLKHDYPEAVRTPMKIAPCGKATLPLCQGVNYGVVGVKRRWHI